MPATGRSTVLIPPLGRGVVKNLPSYLLREGDLVDALNALPDNKTGLLTIRPGYSQFSADTVADRPMGLKRLKTNAGVERFTAATLTKLERFDGTDWTVVPNDDGDFSGANTDHHRLVEFFSGTTNYLVGTNNVDSPYKWDLVTSNDAAAVGGTPPAAARDIIAVAGRLVALNVIDGSDRKPFSIIPGSLNDVDGLDTANIVDLPELQGDIVGGCRLSRTSFAILGESAQAVGIAQLGTSPFRYELVERRPGPISTGSIVEGDGFNCYWMGTDLSFYRMSGIRVEEIGRPIQDYLANNLDSNNKGWVHGTFMRGLRQVWWFFPKSGAIDQGVAYDIDSNAWYPLEFTDEISSGGEGDDAALASWDSQTATWASISGTWNSFSGAQDPTMMLGQTSGLIHRLGTLHVTDNGTAISTVKWTSPLRPYGGLDNNTRIDRFSTYFRAMTSSTTLSVEFGTSDDLGGDDATFDTAVTQDLSSSGPFDLQPDNKDLRGRFTSVRQSLSSPTERFFWKGGVLYHHSLGQAHT